MLWLKRLDQIVNSVTLEYILLAGQLRVSMLAIYVRVVCVSAYQQWLLSQKCACPVVIVRLHHSYSQLHGDHPGVGVGHHHRSAAEQATTSFLQLSRANHVVCVSQKVLNVSEKQGSLPSWFSLPMWWNIQCVLLAWLIIRHPEYMIQKPQLAGSDIFY